MSGLPFEELPAGMSGMLKDEETGETTYIPRRPQQQDEQASPQQYFNSQLEQGRNYLQQQYDAQVNLLKRSNVSDDQFNKSVMKLQSQTESKWQQINFENQQKMGSLNQIDQLTQQGFLSPEAGQRASWQIAGFNMPQPKDWRAQHGQVMTELNNINKVLQSTDTKTGKKLFPLEGGIISKKDYAWGKMPPQRQADLQGMLNAKEVLLQQEREIFQRLPRMQKTATKLQSSYLQQRNRKWAMGKFTNLLRAGPMPSWYARGFDKKPGGFVGSVVKDMPKIKQAQAKRLTREIAAQYLTQYGNRQAAMEAAQQDGYVE